MTPDSDQNTSDVPVALETPCFGPLWTNRSVVQGVHSVRAALELNENHGTDQHEPGEELLVVNSVFMLTDVRNSFILGGKDSCSQPLPHPSAAKDSLVTA